MLKSMTGFGRNELQTSGRMVTVEIRSVNHRYFEFNSRVPRSYGFLEEKLKSFLQSMISRGKLDVYVSIESLEQADVVVMVNHSLAAGYVKALSELSERYSLENNLSANMVSRYPDVLSVRKSAPDEEEIWADVKSCLQTAAEAFVKMREIEGARLKEDILSRCEYILKQVDVIEQRSPQTVKEYQEKLLTRLSEVLADTHIEEQRILTEAAIFADKVAVAEETVRLRSHIVQLGEMLDSNASVGRKLDFIVQEINRETNTIGSKCQNIDITRIVVDIKSEIEKIREQIQNIE